MNNSFLSKLTPKEPKFFPLLKKMSEIAIEASSLLTEFVTCYSHTTAPGYYRQIKEKEREGDKLSNKVFDELNTTFITPFDREDINALANRLDDVTDRINSCAKRILIYNPKKLPEAAVQMAEILHQCVLGINKAVDELDTIKKSTENIVKYCQELHDLENKADEVYENFIIKLFESETNSIELMKIKEIMQELEKATDVAEYAGKIIKTIIVKYA
ncbi:MAG: DUF47 family protein [Prevotellaceae bacterium]|jgi:predicted phosphate transport protein (TIGR00153 family)|nr:DUF47 family protein [Prevotellaceae bacterium]